MLRDVNARLKTRFFDHAPTINGVERHNPAIMVATNDTRRQVSGLDSEHHSIRDDTLMRHGPELPVSILPLAFTVFRFTRCRGLKSFAWLLVAVVASLAFDMDRCNSADHGHSWRRS